MPFRIYEHYDKGYICIGYSIKGGHDHGWMMKTDINGNIRWTKYYGDLWSYVHIDDGKLLPGGEAILFGQALEYQNHSNPMLLKINACGEKEWCRIYPSTGDGTYGYCINLIPQGGFIALIQNWINSLDLWLFRLDSNGYIIWQQQYATNGNMFKYPDAQSLLQTSDTSYLIAGSAYSPDSLYPGFWIQKIFAIKVNLNGAVIFQSPFGNNNGIYCDYAFSSIEQPGHTFLIPGRRGRTSPPNGDSPSLFKFSSTGQAVYYKDLIPDSQYGGSVAISYFLDSTLAVGASWGYSNGDTTGIIKIDSNSNVLMKKGVIINNSESGFWGADLTYNNRLIAIGNVYDSARMNIFIVKLTSDLEFDSLYSQQFTYDSLCPHQIVSDTISLNDCSIVVSVFNPSKDLPKTKLHIYPNPAKNAITIEMPQYLTRQSSGYGVTATTYYHQWNTSTLEIYDLFGKLMYSKEIPKKTKKVKLDVSSWHEGMYVARVVFMNEVVAMAKFVIQ